MRDAISKASGLPKEDNASLRSKKVYCSLYDGTKREIEINGIKYTKSMFAVPDAQGVVLADDQD